MHTVTEILGDYEAQYGKRRVTFKVEGNPNTISGFFKYVPKIGDTLEGAIVQKGQYFNFQFPSKTEAPAGVPDAQYLTLLREIQAVNANVLRVLAFVDTKTSDGRDMPAF